MSGAYHSTHRILITLPYHKCCIVLIATRKLKKSLHFLLAILLARKVVGITGAGQKRLKTLKYILRILIG